MFPLLFIVGDANPLKRDGLFGIFVASSDAPLRWLIASFVGLIAR
jgi:hypothetical protein